MLRQRAIALAFCCLMTVANSQAQTSNQMIGDVPLPSLVISKSTDKPGGEFIGAWLGTWGSQYNHILIVSNVRENGDVDAVYAVGDSAPGNNSGQYFKVKGQIKENVLTVRNDKIFATYTLGNTGRLSGIFGTNSGTSVLTKQDFNALKSGGLKPRWSVGKSELIATDLIENGHPIKLETVLFKPTTEGPFPLAVVNHGSTGSGSDPAVFTNTWTQEWFAEYLNNRGWMVAFPQRRGRGKSGGLYDEGFSKDRSKGYTCETKRSLAGADRALDDLNAAIKALQLRNDVQNTPILLAGVSRGGILSTTYAGEQPKDIKSVINFVGGWISDDCRNAAEINQTLFKRGAAFPGPTKWIYGKDDIFYSSQHSRENFQTFLNSGGNGTFQEVKVQGKNNGHWAMYIPNLWKKSLTKYLDENE